MDKGKGITRANSGRFAVTDIPHEAIIAYMEHGKDKSKLPQASKDLIERLIYADELFREHGDRRKVADILIAKFKIKNTQAYQAIQLAQNFFGNTKKASKEYYRNFMADILSGEIIKAAAAKDWKSLSQLSKELRLTLGYHEQDQDLPDPTMFQIKRTVIGFQPELLGKELPATFKEDILSLVRGIKGVNPTDLLKDIPDAKITG